MSCQKKPVVDHMMHPVELEYMQLEEAEQLHKAKEGVKSQPAREIVPSKSVNKYSKKYMRDALARQGDTLLEECQDIYEEHGVKSRDVRDKLQERHDMQHLKFQLKSLPSTESTTALGRTAVRRLAQRERQQQRRLQSQKEPVVTQRDLERLEKAAEVYTVDQRLDALVAQQEEEKRMQREYDRVKLHFKNIDDARRVALEAKIQKEDLWGTQEKVKVLERAFIAKHEQEEEVKRVNQIILNAKCHAVRDAQIQEKEELQRELREQELKLGEMVNSTAIKHNEEEDQRMEKMREQRANYAKQIRDQLAERETLRFIEAERIEEEAIRTRHAHEAIKRDEEEQKRKARERRLKFKQELASVLEMSNLFKKMLCEQERESEMRIAAYMKQKQERASGLSRQRQVAKEFHERNQQHIFSLAQKVLESKTQREEMSYLRERERMERDYRRKEMESAIRKKQLEEDLAKARELQLEETKQGLALQLARDQKDFETLINKIKEDQLKQQREEEEIARRRRCYRNDIVRQMGDKELDRRRLKELEIKQASEWRENERRRDLNIQDVINSKLQAMRDACLPDKYIRDVEIQLDKIRREKSKIKR